MRFEKVLADAALAVLSVIVLWDILVYFGVVNGHSITEEIQGSWRQWLFFGLVGVIAGGHFLRMR